MEVYLDFWPDFINNQELYDFTVLSNKGMISK